MSPADTTLTQSSPTNFTGVGTHNSSCGDMTVIFLLWQIVGVPSVFVGLPANMCLLWVHIQRQRNGMSDIYMLNHTIINLIINVIILGKSLQFWLAHQRVSQEHEMFSYIINMIYFCFFNGQLLMMACICVDCYLAVVQPITYMNLKRSKYRLATCGLAWGLSFIHGISLSLTNTYMSSLRVIPYVFMLPTIVFCDLSVLHALRKPNPSGGRYVHPQKQRALQIITNSLIITVVAFLPPLVIFLLFTPLGTEARMCYMAGLADLAPVCGSTTMSLLNLCNMGVQNSLTKVLCVLKYFK